jgi:hypothetical protein
MQLLSFLCNIQVATVEDFTYSARTVNDSRTRMSFVVKRADED